MFKNILMITFLLFDSCLYSENYEFETIVDVISSHPVYENFSYDFHNERCWYEKIPIQNNDKIGNNIPGSILGGLIGTRVGKGNGRNASIIIGTILGSQISNNRDSKNYRIEKRCPRYHHNRYKKNIVGYNNKAIFMGREFFKFSREEMRKFNIKIIIEY